jgi:hypothetical protein
MSLPAEIEAINTDYTFSQEFIKISTKIGDAVMDTAH